MTVKQFSYVIFCVHLFASLLFSCNLFAADWECMIFPAEHQTEIDSISGAKIIFATTNKSNDTNLYFHDRCWLPDNRMMLFNSDRTGRQEIFAYIAKTGELARLSQEQDVAAGSPIASRFGDRIYVVKNKSIYQWDLSLTLSPKTGLTIAEKKLCNLPPNSSQLSGLGENSDGTLVSFGYKIEEQNSIAVVDVKTGKQQVVARVSFPIQHFQFSWTRPDLISFARSYGADTAPLDPNEPAHARIWFVNVNTKTPVPAFYQVPGELVTHECWWLNDQITFIGGFMPEEGNVKSLDLKTGEIRILGAGAWLPETPARELSKVNWWHQSGSPDGRWLVADNWHGVISIFDAKTTQQHILTTGHRTYGTGAHPHAGWDVTGDSVEFTSNKRGNADVCIGVLPNEW
jgi:hypothetical protein